MSLSAEWELVRGFANQWFKGELTQVGLGSWLIVLPDGTTPEDVTAAFKRLVAGGQVFMPTPGEVSAALPSRELDAPSFGEVIGVIDGARFKQRREAVALVTEKLGGTAAAWMCAEGVERLRGMELAGEYAGAARRSLQQSYESFVAGQAERARQGRPLLVATPDGRTARSDLRRVEPLKALEGGEAA